MAVDVFKLTYGNLTNEDIKKYSFLIDIDVDNLKETLQDLTLNYYKYYINGDAVNFKETARELNKFIDLDIPAINNYINFSLVIASYQILNKLYNTNFDFYAPANPGLNIKGYNERNAENTIKLNGLTPMEVKEVIEYNKKAIDLSALNDLERDLKENEKTKYIKLDKPAIDGAYGLFNTYYTGDFDLKQQMKVHIFMDLMFYSHYEVSKMLAEAGNRPIFDIDKNKVNLNDAPSDKLKNGGLDGA